MLGAVRTCFPAQCVTLNSMWSADSDLLAMTSTSKSLPPFTRIKIISLGDGGVGKSCLIKRYCEQKFVSRYISTIGVDFGVKSVILDGEPEIKVNFWDLSGHDEYYDVRNEFYTDTQGAILVYDVSNRASFQSLERWLQEAQMHGAGKFFTAVCGNKVDVGKPDRAVTETEGRKWAESKGFPYYETSAKNGDNVAEMFELLFRSVVTAGRHRAR